MSKTMCLNYCRIPFAQVATLLVLVLLLPLRPAAGQVQKASLDELVGLSTSVVLGQCTQKQSFWNEGRTKIFTEVTVRVDELVKGESPAETVITIPGGRVGNTIYEVSDMPVFVEGEEVLVFLWQHPSGKELVTGAAQGVFSVVKDEVTGRRVVPGMLPLLQEEKAAGKSGVAGPPAVAKIAVEDAVAAIRARLHE